jgi:oligopeptide/dipeptide ABC transporter ATP-binding protein
MSVAAPVIEVRDLSIGFPSASGGVQAAQEVSFDLYPGETLGLVGESGCGKSVTLRSIIGLVPPPGRVTAGRIVYAGSELTGASRSELGRIRGREISMVFQDPASALNPVLSIGDQLREVLRRARGLGRRTAQAEAVRLLDRVGIASAERRVRDYPHQLSGGMRQRVMIAMAIACEPKVLLADEPTTALDVTIQDQILSLLVDLQAEAGLSVVLVSHDLGVIGQACARVAVMYAGRIVETGSVDDVLERPRHPYTEALLDAVPEVRSDGAVEPLQPIGGQPPALDDLPPGCSFAPRCRYAMPECANFPMTLDRHPTQPSACLLAHRGER